MEREYQIQFLENQISVREERLTALDKKLEELEKLQNEIKCLEQSRTQDERDVVELKLWLNQIKGEIHND